MGPPTTPFQPYASLHTNLNGPGDVRPTALQIIKDCNAAGQLQGSAILITGCSSGLGVTTAEALYETGAKLYLTARDIPKLNRVIDDIVSKSTSSGIPRPESIEIHLDSLESVRKGADTIKAKTFSLNMLINNAGVMACPLSRTQDGFELQFGTNHLAPFLLTELLTPLLLKGAKDSGKLSRVINLSSVGHIFGPVRFDDWNWNDEGSYDKWAAYGQSKTANIYMANSITRRYGPQGITAVSVHPGGIMTELVRHLSESDIEGIGSEGAFDKYWKNPEQGSATTVWAAVSPRFDELGNGGRYLMDVGEVGPIEGEATVMSEGYADYAYDEEKEEKLWKLSAKAVGIAE